MRGLTLDCAKDKPHVFSQSGRAQHRYRRLMFACTHPLRFRDLQRKRRLESREGYSFKPFIDRRCIFVHIPKCAGVSVARSLFGNLAGGHTTMRTYEIAFTPEEFATFFKFTIVRNPWDRVLSAFLFLKKGGMNEADRAWAEKHLSRFHDFNGFVRYGLTSREVRLGTHFRQQCDFICIDRAEPAVDFIGFYENLGADFDYISQRLNLRASLLSANKNESRTRDYQSYYSEETRSIVAKVYADDIRLLGYTFDNRNLRQMLAARNCLHPKRGGNDV
jgi:hypothetical protein